MGEPTTTAAPSTGSKVGSTLSHAMEGFTHLVTNLVTVLPVIGPYVKQYLPTDKPDYQSATVKAGVLWGLLEVLCATVPIVFPAAAPVCLSISHGLKILGPALMLLGVRKTVIDTSNIVPPKP